MYTIRTIPAGPFMTNAYLVGPTDGEQMTLIDAPPDSEAAVQRVLDELGRTLAAVVITHPHFDHTLDASLFSAQQVPIYAHSDAVEGIRHPQTLGLVADPPGGFPESGDITPLIPGASLELAGMDFRVLEVPGHSDGSVALYLDGHCFVGDVIFAGSIGRTDLPGGSMEVLTESIVSQIYTLPDETILYPGHGPETDVGTEKHTNPFVRG